MHKLKHILNCVLAVFFCVFIQLFRNKICVLIQKLYVQKMVLLNMKKCIPSLSFTLFQLFVSYFFFLPFLHSFHLSSFFNSFQKLLFQYTTAYAKPMEGGGKPWGSYMRDPGSDLECHDTRLLRNSVRIIYVRRVLKFRKIWNFSLSLLVHFCIQQV